MAAHRHTDATEWDHHCFTAVSSSEQRAAMMLVPGPLIYSVSDAVPALVRPDMVVHLFQGPPGCLQRMRLYVAALFCGTMLGSWQMRRADQSPPQRSAVRKDIAQLPRARLLPSTHAARACAACIRGCSQCLKATAARRRTEAIERHQLHSCVTLIRSDLLDRAHTAHAHAAYVCGNLTPGNTQTHQSDRTGPLLTRHG